MLKFKKVETQGCKTIQPHDSHRVVWISPQHRSTPGRGLLRVENIGTTLCGQRGSPFPPHFLWSCSKFWIMARTDRNFLQEGKEGGDAECLWFPVFQALLAIQATPLRDHMLLADLWVHSQSPRA